jgi:hypothetical protein
MRVIAGAPIAPRLARKRVNARRRRSPNARSLPATIEVGRRSPLARWLSKR